jgi:hypothetical protein
MQACFYCSRRRNAGVIQSNAIEALIGVITSITATVVLVQQVDPNAAEMLVEQVGNDIR